MTDDLDILLEEEQRPYKICPQSHVVPFSRRSIFMNVKSEGESGAIVTGFSSYCPDCNRNYTLNELTDFKMNPGSSLQA